MGLLLQYLKVPETSLLFGMLEDKVPAGQAQTHCQEAMSRYNQPGQVMQSEAAEPIHQLSQEESQPLFHQQCLLLKQEPVLQLKNYPTLHRGSGCALASDSRRTMTRARKRHALVDEVHQVLLREA